LTAAVSTPFNVSATTPLPTQIFGPTAIGTSISVSQAEFPVAGSAHAVVLARSDYFSDALAGGPLAAAVDGPLLITPGADLSATLDPGVQAEILRVLPLGDTVYILGGVLALSPTIDATLVTLGYVVVREAGIDLYGTAIDIAQALGNPTTIFEATGLTFYDALSSVPAAIEDHGAILLTDGSTQDPETATYLAAHPADTRYAIGGPAAALGADPSAIGVFGADAYATSAAVATFFFPNANSYGVATGLSYTDALSGGVFMATGGRLGPILLVDPSVVPSVSASVAAYLGTLAHGTQGYVIGGPLAVPAQVLTSIQADVG
jgi:putative cell wall-binding protein